MDIDNLAVTHIKKNKPPTAIESFVPYDRPYGLTFGHGLSSGWGWAFSGPNPN